MPLPVTVTFDGIARRIILGPEAGNTTINVLELYSAWKLWVGLGNAGYPPAFGESVGGNDLGGGQLLGQYVFVRNDIGWRIRPDERTHKILLSGNIFGFSAAEDVFVSTLGAYTVRIEVRTSAQAIVLDGGAGDPGVVLDAPLLNHSTPGSVGMALQVTQGLAQHLMRIDNVVYDGNVPPNMTSSRVRLFATKTALDASTPGGTGEGEIYTHNVAATYDESLRLSGYTTTTP